MCLYVVRKSFQTDKILYVFFLHGYFSNWLEVREMSYIRALSGVIFLWFVRKPLSSELTFPVWKHRTAQKREKTKTRALERFTGNTEVYPNLSRRLEKMTLLHSFLKCESNSVEDHSACGDNLFIYFLDFLQLTQVAMRLRLLHSAVQKLALVSEDYHG